LICDRLTGGKTTAIDRSAPTVDIARGRNVPGGEHRESAPLVDCAFWRCWGSGVPLAALVRHRVSARQEGGGASGTDYVLDRSIRLVSLVVAFVLLSPVQFVIEERHHRSVRGSFPEEVQRFVGNVWRDRWCRASHCALCGCRRNTSSAEVSWGSAWLRGDVGGQCRGFAARRLRPR
jgi:hypothetical protein